MTKCVLIIQLEIPHNLFSPLPQIGQLFWDIFGKKALITCPLSNSSGLKTKNILTVLLSHDLVYDASNNTPAIVKGQINLGSKFGWFELLSTKNNMPWGIFHIESGNVTKLQNVWSCQKSLNSPPEIKYSYFSITEVMRILVSSV